MRFYKEVGTEMGELAACIYTAIESQLRQGTLGTIRECDGIKWIQKGLDQLEEEFPDITPSRLAVALRKLSRSDWLESGIPRQDLGIRRLWYTLGKKRVADPRMEESSIRNEDPSGELVLEPRGKGKPTHLDRWLARKPTERAIEQHRKRLKQGFPTWYKAGF